MLGLIASDNLIISQFAPQTLSWRAATLAQSGEWYTDTSSSTHTSMTFTGSIATAQGGYASMFATRTYNYDQALQTLRPPLFPTIENSWSVQYWHEVSPRDLSRRRAGRTGVRDIIPGVLRPVGFMAPRAAGGRRPG